MSQPQYSRGFHITNNETHNLKLVSVTGEHFDSKPDAGYVLPPNGTDGFEVTFMFLQDQYDLATYDILDGQGKTIGTYIADMTVLPGAGASTSGCGIRMGSCTPNPPLSRGEDPWNPPYPCTKGRPAAG